MKVLIIEDEIPAFKRLTQLINEIEPSWQIIDQLDEVTTAVKWLETNPAPDLIFMDVQLADGFSFDIFQQVEVKSPVIFATAFDQYAIDAFRVNGLDYILKPIQKEILVKSIERFKVLQVPDSINMSKLSEIFNVTNKRYKERFLIKSGDELNFIKVSEIAYFLSEASYSFIVTKSGNRYIVDQTINQIESKIDPELFFRINRKQIISLDAIAKISAYFNNRLKLDLAPVENSDVIVSRSRVKEFKEWLNQ